MYRRIHHIQLLLWLPCILLAYMGTAQPVLSSKLRMHGYDVFRDHTRPSLYYYSPPEIRLKEETGGRPAFTLIQMRYTGTYLYNDRDFKGFLNILQLSILLDPITAETFAAIKNDLGRNCELRPMPVRSFSGELIIPLGDAAAANEKYKKVGLNALDHETGAGQGQTFWQERTFTLQLDNHEAQLLWDQVTTGKLAISFSYAFYADAMPGNIAVSTASGTEGEVLETLRDIPEELLFDNKINTYLVKANTFPITINVTEHPECLRRVDINEEMPPAYAAFEVRCYDFTDNLRPDLFKKIVEIKAFAAAKEYISVKADFSRNKPDIHGIRARFPYAIRMDKPMEYRVTEILADGTSDISQWMPIGNWSEVIDVTTPYSENTIRKKSLDIEFDTESLAANGIASAECELTYSLSGQTIVQRISWEPDGTQPLHTIQFQYDIRDPLRYRVIYLGETREVSAYLNVELTDDYLFIRRNTD